MSGPEGLLANVAEGPGYRLHVVVGATLLHDLALAPQHEEHDEDDQRRQDEQACQQHQQLQLSTVLTAKSRDIDTVSGHFVNVAH